MAGRGGKDLGALLEEGVALFNAGDPAGAEACFKRVLKRRPKDANALHLMGLCRHQAGDPEKAATLIRTAVAHSAPDANMLSNLGQVLNALGRHDEAADAFRRALRAGPETPQVLNNLANALAKGGDPEGAERHYRMAIAGDPGYVVAHYNLGSLYVDQDDIDAAIDSFGRALALVPGYAEAHNNLGRALEKKGDLDAALERYERALALKPDFVEAANNIGNVMKKKGDIPGARAAYENAMAIDPDDAGAYTNLGVVLSIEGRPEEARALHEKALALDPGLPDAHHNLGVSLLRMGDLAAGWAEYEWRWRVDEEGIRKRNFPQTPWRGEPVQGRSILVWSEQGVGDEIIFASMVPDLAAAGADVILESDYRLVPLYERSFPNVRCVPRGNATKAALEGPGIDFQAPAGNLGRWLRPRLDAFPDRWSYLVADAARRDALRQRYRADGDDRLVGIAWHSKNAALGAFKSMSLVDWAPLAKVPGLRFVDLQYGDTADERAAFAAETGVPVLRDDAVDQMTDLDGFAAQIAAMDLVVTISNTTAHMAGALGVPTWVLLHTVPLTFWMLEGESSPWYPSARLFRQSRAGRWDDVIRRVAAELQRFNPGG